MALLDSILGAVTQKTTAGGGGAAALVGVMSSLLEANGGLQGLANRFAQNGQGNAFSSWVGMGENQAVSGDQIQKALGSEQVAGIANELGVDPSQVSHLLAEYLPKVVDKLPPQGQVDPNANHQEGLAALVPALLQNFMGGNRPA